jgi:hypothetical protein
VVQRANLLQIELGEGPCLDVVRTQETLVIPDLEQEHRWSTWARRVRDACTPFAASTSTPMT